MSIADAIEAEANEFAESCPAGSLDHDDYETGRLHGLRRAAEIAREALKADAERLAELREEYVRLQRATAIDRVTTADAIQRRDSVRTLIAVYEECAARGIAFGGGR